MQRSSWIMRAMAAVSLRRMKTLVPPTWNTASVTISVPTWNSGPELRNRVSVPRSWMSISAMSCHAMARWLSIAPLGRPPKAAV